jgi:energy-coupling factor transport system permease protein
VFKDSIMFGQYLPGETILHRLDPRAKIVCAIFLALAVLLSGAWVTGGLLTLVVIFFIYLSRLSWRLVLKIIRPFLFIIGLTIVLQITLTPGETVFQAGFIHVTREGLVFGGQFLWRLTLIVVVTSLLTVTTSPLDLTAAVEHLSSPLSRIGIPVHDLAMMMTMALCFLPSFLREAQTIIKAQQARGAGFHSGRLWRRFYKIIPLIIPLLAGSLRRADGLALAMEARCYRVGVKRTRMHPLSFCRRDLIAVSLSAAFLLLSAIYR